MLRLLCGFTYNICNVQRQGFPTILNTLNVPWALVPLDWAPFPRAFQLYNIKYSIDRTVTVQIRS